MSVLVWVNAWDFGSSPVSIGDEMVCSLETVQDRDWLAAVLEDEMARAIDYTWDRNGDGPIEGTPRVRVLGIRSAHARYTPSPSRPGLSLSVPGTWMLSPLSRADGHEAEIKDRFLSGYIFEVLVLGLLP